MTTLDRWKNALADAGSQSLAEIMRQTLTAEKIEEFISKHPPIMLLDFMALPDNVRRHEILEWLDNYQQDRFSAEPVYGPTGKGFLVSRGVDGLVAEQNLANALATAELGGLFNEFCQLLTIGVMNHLKTPEIGNELGLL